VFSGQANVADAVVKSATLTTRPILHIIRSRRFGHGRHLIVATESFDQIGHNHARWGTWAQLEDVYYKTLPNYRIVVGVPEHAEIELWTRAYNDCVRLIESDIPEQQGMMILAG
jgi:hypothetical protein